MTDTIRDIRAGIEKEAKRLGLNAKLLIREYGVTSALLDSLKNTKAEEAKDNEGNPKTQKTGSA